MNILPNTLTHLRLANALSLGILPPSLQHLKFYNKHRIELTQFPPKLTHLSYKIFSPQLYNAVLPNTLTHLVLRSERVPSSDFFPHNLRHLKLVGITSLHTSPLSYTLPSLTHVKFGGDFNEPVDFLPHSITYLDLGGSFNQPVDNLPLSLKKITFSTSFNPMLTTSHPL